MATAYTLKALLGECAAKRARVHTAVPKADKERVFAEVWRALNAWVADCLARGKGASIVNFGRLALARTTNLAGRVVAQKPIFLMAESFARAHGLSRKKKLVPAELTTCEELNFTKIAIKFSRELTKDVVFAATRDLLQRLGEVIGRGRRVDVAFGDTGRLVAKERRVKFVFDPAHTLGVMASTPSAQRVGVAGPGQQRFFYQITLESR